MKRFTETEKWRDPWFQKLDKEVRTLWLWLCDRVDNAGVVDVCWPICNAETGGNFSDETMSLLGERVEKLETGKWWIPKFVEFQFGKLSEASKVHQSIEKLLSKHTLSHRVGHRVCNTLKEKDKDKEKEEEKSKERKEMVFEIPMNLATDGFKPVWNEWVKYRLTFKKPKNFEAMFNRQLLQLSDWGLDAAIASLKNAMAQGYQGFFRPKNITEFYQKPDFVAQNVRAAEIRKKEIEQLDARNEAVNE